jgi:Sec-independent protein translocase protein TatA
MSVIRWSSSHLRSRFEHTGHLLDELSKLTNSRRRIARFRVPHYDEFMSFSETIFLFLLALIVFGPKKLPEIARQAGKLLAELRRASNEFKSQIETEIAHLEVEKSQTILPPARPPQGAVASLSLNPAQSDPVPQEAPATLAAPVVEATPEISEPAVVAEPANLPASQDSHV